MKNKASGIGASLKRKIGPLPVWVWAIAFFGLVWYYRNKLSAGSSAVSGTGTGSVGPAPATPQAQTVLQPGESVYDPNTGALATAPGGSAVGSGMDYASMVQAIEDAIAAGEMGVAGTGGTSAPAGGAGTAPPSGPAPAVKRTKKLAAVTKRIRKPKAQHGAPKRTTKPPAPHSKRKPRSTSNVRPSTGGRTTAKAKAPVAKGRIRGTAQAHASVPRVHSTTHTAPLVSKPTVRQRPTANATPHRATPAPSVHRVASTPPRTASRTVTKPKPKPKPRKR